MTGFNSKNSFQDSKPTKELFENEVDKSSKNVVEKNNNLTMDKDEFRGTENEMDKKPTELSQSMIKDHSQGLLKNNLNTKNNLCSSEENFLQRETPQLAAKIYVSEETSSSYNIKERSNFNFHQIKPSSNVREISTSMMSQFRSTYLPVSQSESSKLVSTNPSLVCTVKDSSFNPVKEVPPFVDRTSTTQTLHESHEENLTQSNSGSIVFNSKSNILQIEHSQHVTAAVNNLQSLSNKNEEYKKLNLSSLKNENSSSQLVPGELSSLGSCAPIVKSGSTEYVNNDKLTDSRSYSNKYKSIEVSSDLVFSKHDVILDPLPMSVRTVSEPRELTDFEFNVFPVAHEVEVCSATDSMLEDFVNLGSSEIGHPDWPIASEQSVIDSSNLVSYSSTPDQYLYTSNLSSDQCCALNEMTQNVIVNSLELQQVSVDFRCPDNNVSDPNKEDFNLHFKTLEVDYDLCCSQRKFQVFYLSKEVPPMIPVPLPPQGCLDNMKSSVRCTCRQCSGNHQKLLSNYNILKKFRNSKFRPINLYSKSVDFSLTDENSETNCSLPLKKRKILTDSESTKQPQLTSYPNTPMISIAQLELTNFEQQNQIVSNNQSH